MIIPSALADRWRTRSRRNALSKLKSLLEFRELMEEYRAEGVLMQAYKEAADAMLISPETLRRDMATVREYPKDKLIYWIQNGVSFDHIETSNNLAEIAHKAPADLLDEAIELGNETGETMTVPELTQHALGEHPVLPPLFWVNRLFTSLCKSPTRWGWDAEKTHRWNDWIEQGKEFFRS